MNRQPRQRLRVLTSAFLLMTPSLLFAQEQDTNVVPLYLFQWIRFICYGLGGIAGIVGLLFLIFGFWTAKVSMMKSGMIAAVAGFAFVIVIPFSRIVFSDWVSEFTEEDAFIPDADTSFNPIELEPWQKSLVAEQAPWQA